MPTDLKRDLGLSETFAIAVGAMIGSGIFVLPGVAFVSADAGPRAVLGFIFAAVLVLPAALAVAEMSTAMPEDGGPYLYVDRSMGPLLGTIAGVGTWLMLNLKSALALVGGVPYLLFVSDSLADPVVVTAIALGLAILFTVVNLVSAEGSGKLQFALVGILITILGAYVLGGIPEIQSSRVEGAFNPTQDSINILEATAIVFISYAGLTKVGAVAEEVADPGRNLPLAIGGALAFVAFVYAVVVYVTFGVYDVAEQAGQITPVELLTGEGEGAIIALAAEGLFGGFGEIFAIAIVVAALMALASTANAGLLAASRFPLAMARDGVFPSKFEQVSERFATPVYAVALTGGILALLTFLPIGQVAAFGSAFQILVFMLLNVALIGFREGALEGYNPAFETPLYPWMPLFGIAGGLLVLWFTGPIAVAGALGIALLAVIWYVVYVRRSQAGEESESAVQAGARESVGQRAVERTRELFESTRRYDVLVAITENTSADARRDMVRVASDLGRLRTAVVSVVEFIDVPDHISPGGQTGAQSETRPDWLPEDPEEAPEWYPDSGRLRTSGGVAVESAEDAGGSLASIEYREIDSRDHREAIVDFATFEDVDLLLVERQAGEGFTSLLGSRETEWILQHAPCDVALVEDRGFEGIEEIAVASRGEGPYDGLKLLIADAIAEETGAELNLLRAIPEGAAPERRESAEKYHNDLMSILTVPTRSTVLETDDPVDGVARFAGDADLLVTGVSRGGTLDRLRGSPPDQLVEAVDCTAIMVQTNSARQRTLYERLVLDRLF